MNPAHRFDKLLPDIHVQIPPELTKQAARTLQAGEKALAAQERTHDMIQAGMILAGVLAAVFVVTKMLRR